MNFYDERRVHKIIVPTLGPEEKAKEPGLYSRSLQAPLKLEVNLIKGEY